MTTMFPRTKAALGRDAQLAEMRAEIAECIERRTVEGLGTIEVLKRGVATAIVDEIEPWRAFAKEILHGHSQYRRQSPVYVELVVLEPIVVSTPVPFFFGEKDQRVDFEHRKIEPGRSFFLTVEGLDLVAQYGCDTQEMRFRSPAIRQMKICEPGSTHDPEKVVETPLTPKKTQKGVAGMPAISA